MRDKERRERERESIITESAKEKEEGLSFNETTRGAHVADEGAGSRRELNIFRADVGGEKLYINIPLEIEIE